MYCLLLLCHFYFTSDDSVNMVVSSPTVNTPNPTSTVPIPEPPLQPPPHSLVVIQAEIHPPPSGFNISNDGFTDADVVGGLPPTGVTDRSSDIHEQSEPRLYEDLADKPVKVKRKTKRGKARSGCEQDNGPLVRNSRSKRRKAVAEILSETLTPDDASSAHSSPFPRISQEREVDDWRRNKGKPKKEYGRMYRMLGAPESNANTVDTATDNSQCRVETDHERRECVEVEVTEPDKIASSSSPIPDSGHSKSSSSSKSVSLLKKAGTKRVNRSEVDSTIVVSSEHELQTSRKSISLDDRAKHINQNENNSAMVISSEHESSKDVMER